MLIRTCFCSLLRAVLNNLHIEESQYTISQMPLKSINLTQIEEADVIFFAGGGLFGLSYLDFYDYMKEIIDIAETNHTPVIFSSIGVNNMDAKEENEEKLFSLLQNSCIKAISVRENLQLFQKYLNHNNIPIEQVCDPAVWAKQVYAQQLSECQQQVLSVSDDSKSINLPTRKKCIGINVVRGGLFEANGLAWKLKDEVEYLNSVKEKLEDAGYDYRFYTNGSLLDDNAMRFFAKEKNIPEDKLLFVHSSTDLVQAIAGFDAVAAIRMHSSILSYSFQLPTLNLIWNDKIQHFYRNIGYPERAISLDNWTGKAVADQLIQFLNQKNTESDESLSQEHTTYLMTLYTFLFHVLAKGLKVGENYAPYSFEEIVSILASQRPSLAEELTDVRYKIQRGEGHYLARFYEIREKNQQIKAFTKENEKLNKKVEKQDSTLQKKTETIEKLKLTIEKNNQEIEEQKQIIQKQQEELQQHLHILRNTEEELRQFYRSFLGRIYRKIKK